MTVKHDWCNGGCVGCPEDPKALLGQPIGQYHCPHCEMMLLAGDDHPTCAQMDAAIEKHARECESAEDG